MKPYLAKYVVNDEQVIILSHVRGPEAILAVAVSTDKKGTHIVDDVTNFTVPDYRRLLPELPHA